MHSMFRAVPAALALAIVAGTARAQQPFRIAYVNTEALMVVAPGRAQVDTVLQREGDSYRAQLKKMQDSLDAMVSDFQKKDAANTLTAAQKDAKQKAMQALNADIQARNAKLQQQFQQHQNDLMAPILETVRKVLEDIRVEDGYSMILANDPGQTVIVASDKNLDITERVVARLKTVAATTRTPTPTPTPTPAAKPGTPTPAGVTKPIKPPAP